MPPVATGPVNTLADGAGSTQIGIGSIAAPNTFRQGAALAVTGTVTLTAAQLAAGLIDYVGAGHSLTLPLATDMDAAFANMGADSAFDFSVIATTGTATLVTAAGWTIDGRLTTAASTASRYRARKTAAGAWTLYLIA